MEQSTLDHLRRQIRLRLKRNGATQKQLAEALGHSGQWLSMILREKRGIKISEIDKIAAFLRVKPAWALFRDPDHDPSLLGEAFEKGAQNGDSSIPSRGVSIDAAVRLLQQWEIDERVKQGIKLYRSKLTTALAQIRPGMGLLDELEAYRSDRNEDRGAPFSPGADRSKRARAATGNRN